MILWIASPLCDDIACWHAALRVLRAEAAKLGRFVRSSFAGSLPRVMFLLLLLLLLLCCLQRVIFIFEKKRSTGFLEDVK